APVPAGKRAPTVSVCGANSVSPRPARPPRAPASLAPATRGAPVLLAPPKGSAMSDPNALAHALAMTQQSLAALQRMQEQTAALHKQFLDGQEAAQRTLQTLVEQQQALLVSGIGTGAPVALAPPVAPPAPKPAQEPSVGSRPPLAAPPATTILPAGILAAALAPPAPVAPPVPKPAPKPTQEVSAEATVGSRPPLAAPAKAPERDRVSATLLAVVSEKTGYPVDSLDLSLSLDSDLGVDSIKRVEILSALQEKLPDAPVVKPEHLGALHTLKDVADFLAGGAPATTKIPLLDVNENLLTKPVTPQMEIAPAATDSPVPDTEQLSGKAPPHLTDSAAAALKGSRGAIPKPAPRAPAETLRQPVGPFGDRVDRSILQLVDLDLTAPRPRVPLAPGAEVWVVGDGDDPLTGAVAEQLKAKGFAPRAFAWAGADGAKPPAGPLVGLVLLAPVAPGPESGLNRRAFDWLKLAAPKLRHAGRAGGAVFTTVARLDGAFGLGELAPDADPTAGGLAGLAKTALREWPEVTCKALDLSPAVTDPAAGAAAVVDEVLSTGPVEIGIAANHRCVLELARTARRPNAQLINLGTRDVVLVTGGARGVTAEVAVALAETYCPTLVLTGRTPAPTAEPEYLAGVTGETEMKAAIAAALGADANPRAIGDLYKKVLAQREVRRTLERAQQAGAKVAYFSVDITDERAVADLLHKVRVKHGPVTAVVHGAGVLADKRIEDLTGEQFDHVYATKVDGLRTLLDLIGNDDLKALVLFSSTTARLGRVGQLAYACANEVLNKTAQVEARRRAGARVVSINWGPWDGGMVTGGLRKLFEAEGVGVIPLLEGATFLIQELNAAGRAVEVVALAKPPARGAGGSGVVPKPGSGATPPPAALPAPVMSPPNPLPSADLTVAFERVVDVATHPVLRSHVLDGLAVLPVALHLEWLAHAALHGSPGLQFHGFNDLRVTAGLKVDAGEPVPVRALAGKPVKQDKLFLVPVELRGKRKDGREVVFSRAEIVLAQALPKAPPADAPPQVTPVHYDPARAYAEYLFHGPDLQGIAELVGRGSRAFVAGAYPAPPPADWFEFPLRSAWIADPLALDTAFQVMILWTQGEHGTGSLPSFVGRYRQFRKGYPADPITVVARVTRDDARFARADIDFLAPDGAVIAQMQDYECVMEASLNDSFRKNQLVGK
ncbi:MAG: SDR family NAD(P)-dependent oxidoreductase, partial [Planctomycetes bacterium]|nr:SDR family NAD(P)-dependent oxidoreductase [Planctomycetota bacterium]